MVTALWPTTRDTPMPMSRDTRRVGPGHFRWRSTSARGGSARAAAGSDAGPTRGLAQHHDEDQAVVNACCLSWSNSAWSIAPASSRDLADAIWSAAFEPAEDPATDRMYSACC